MEGKRGIYDIAEICRFHGVETAVLCPGSRCAPLTLAFSRTEGVRCMSIVDERSAAFIALGIAETTQKPVVLVCTSGSAVLNFGPALAEAFYRHIPLVVLTADRPQRLVGQQDGQTMNQPNVFANYIKESFSLVGDAQSDEELAYVQRTINAALIKSKAARGPVHVNISFEEPLYKLADEEKPARCISYVESTPSLDKLLKEALPHASKWLFVIGSRKNDAAENQLLEKIAGKIPVLSESISNFHAGSIRNANEIIRSISADEKTALVPDVLVTFGEGIISKNLKGFIRTHKPKRHIHIDAQGEVIDTYQCLTDVVALSISDAISAIAENTTPDSAYLDIWKSASQRTAEKVRQTISTLAFGDLRAMDFVTKQLPPASLVHVSNSMAVRYLNICAGNLQQPEVFCNRGTSGIDGSISTALGNAIGTSKSVWVITGDLSFQYDGNALWNGFVPTDLKIIIINNSGGGIFRLIDGPSSVPELTERFETRTESSAEYKALQHGLAYFSCTDEESLATAWADFIQETGKACILEIFTDPIANENIFKSFQQQLSNKI